MARTPRPIANSGIAAQAVAFLELAPLSSVADDDPVAREAATALVLARRMCLEAEDWSAVSTRQRLIRLPDAELYDERCDSAYQIPPDCLVVRSVSSWSDECDWRREGRALLVRHWRAQPAPIARYTADTDREDELPPHLQVAIALQLAVLMVDRNVTATNKKEALLAQLQDVMTKARRFCAREASPERYDGHRDAGDWVTGAIL